MVQTHSRLWQKHNIIIEHYIISSGLKEMIEGTVMAQAGEFEKSMQAHFILMIMA